MGAKETAMWEIPHQGVRWYAKCLSEDFRSPCRLFDRRENMIRKIFYSGVMILIMTCTLLDRESFGGPIYGPSPNGSVPGGAVPGNDANPPDVPTGLVPSPNSPGFNGANSSGQPELPGNSAPVSPQSNNPANPINPNSPNSGPNNQGQPQSNAPTFMNNAIPNSSNPFLPNNISPGLLSGPLENAYLQDGVPQLAAPMMSAVYRPFGLTFFQPNPFQVTPQGNISISGMFGEESNANFSPNQPEWGSFFDITPAVYYSNFDDYGYISLLASASYYQYDTGNIPPYLDETAGISAGTYLGDRVFVGAQDLGFVGYSPGMSGSPLAFFNGINPYYGNMANAEIGVALTPKITFVQGASDMYFNDAGYGAGLMNIQSLTDTLNYMDKTNYLSLSYIYQQGLFSLFPGFVSDGLMGTAMRSVSPTTSLGVGGSASYYLYAQSNLAQNFFVPSSNSSNFYMTSYYGIFTRQMTPSLSFSAQGGWNAISFYSGETFQSPLIDLNLAYSGPRLGLGINVGEFMENMTSYGVEMGPEKTKNALGYLTYAISPKTSFFSSVGYTLYDFLNPYSYSNNFFQTLQPNLSYSGSYLYISDGIFYQPVSWLNTSLIYNLMNFSTNVPNETIIENTFLAVMTFMWSFN